MFPCPPYLWPCQEDTVREAIMKVKAEVADDCAKHVVELAWNMKLRDYQPLERAPASHGKPASR